MTPSQIFTRRAKALRILRELNINPGQHSHELTGEQITGLLRHADLVKYQKPKTASGSRVRYFHNKLQRYANPNIFPRHVAKSKILDNSLDTETVIG